MTLRLAIALLAGASLLLAAWRGGEVGAPSAEVRGVGLGLFASDVGYDYGDLVAEIADRGAADIILVVQWSQSSNWSHDVGPGPRTATEAALVRTIEQARHTGMRVTLMPIIRLDERTAQQWRGSMQPDTDRWFEMYGGHLVALARTAQAAGVERFVVGSELSSLQPHEERWRALIAQVRKVFRGRVTYSANWDAFDSVGFWDALDEASVTAYFPLSTAPDPTVVDLAASWSEPMRRLSELERRIGRPVLLTEVGYPSHERAAATPWDQTNGTTAAPALQAKLYRSFCDAFAGSTADGYYFWNWFGYGGPREISFTPRGKPAAAELERCLRLPTREMP